MIWNFTKLEHSALTPKCLNQVPKWSISSHGSKSNGPFFIEICHFWLLWEYAIFATAGESLSPGLISSLCKISTFTAVEKWVSWQNQQFDFVPSKDSDQPGICPVWSAYLLWAQLFTRGLSCFHESSKDSNWTGWMSRLLCAKSQIAVLSLTGSCVFMKCKKWK